MKAVVKRASATPKRVTPRTRTAFHEAGHAVLSAAINDTPHLVSIRPNGDTLGRSLQKGFARPSSMAQIALAGFVAEHILTGRRSRQFDQEVGFAMVANTDRRLREAFPGSEHQDGYLAVEHVLRTGVPEAEDDIRREVDRLYEIAWKSLSAVWPAVKCLATALLKHEELDRAGVEKALESFALFTKVLPVQRAHGLLLPVAR